MTIDSVNTVSVERDHDRGFSLVEMLVTIVVLGILATITVFAVRGITNRGEDSSCGTDVRILETSADVYFVQTGVDTIPPTGTADGDEYERTLIDAGYLGDVSTFYDLNPDGTVSTNGDPCS